MLRKLPRGLAALAFSRLNKKLGSLYQIMIFRTYIPDGVSARTLRAISILRRAGGGRISALQYAVCFPLRVLFVFTWYIIYHVHSLERGHEVNTYDFSRSVTNCLPGRGSPSLLEEF